MNKNSTRKQLAALIKLQLVNLYGINEYKYTKNPTEKKKKFWLGIAYVAVAVMLMSYVGGMSYGYVYIGLGNILPAYLIMLTSVIILAFSACPPPARIKKHWWFARHRCRFRNRRI